jgi:eukaryotic-like serine/threonine-protein kinase
MGTVLVSGEAPRKMPVPGLIESGEKGRMGTVVFREDFASAVPAGTADDPPWLAPDWAGTRAIFGPMSAGPEESGDVEALTGPTVGVCEGMRIGQYELIRQLGRGGMGVVFLARDNKLGRRVAIKFLQFHHPELTRRFIVEARATARCTHENIVVIHEVGEHEGAPFMVLEYVDGQPLSDLREGKPQPMTRVVEIMVAVVRALARAHDEGIVHRDLKPENVLLGHAGTIKVLDFGIAKLLESASGGADGPASIRGPASVRRDSPSPEGQKTGLVGTMAYMSPEQWGVFDQIDHRTDFWSVGLMLYELLSGIHPLTEVGDVASWVKRLDLPMPSLSSVAPNLPAELVRVVDTCLNKYPDGRYANARDLLRELEPFLPGRYQAGQAQIETGPYAGLRTFQEEDASRFFGRNSERAELLARLRDTALLAVVGPSGVGKSSFLRAGVIPALKSSDNWSVLVVRPGRHPMQALVDLCLQMLDPESPELRRPNIEMDLRTRLFTEAGAFGNLARDFCRRERRRLLLLVDQFEELYTLSPHVLERRAFTACLSGAADDAASPVRVVLTVRADFMGRIAEDPQFMNELRKGLFFLGPPSVEGLRDALIQPAEGAGYRFEKEAVVGEMVHFLEASPNGLPLLQFAASQLWEARDPVRRLLTEQSYRGLGGVAGALVSHADRVVSHFTGDRQTICRRVFVHLVTPERTRAVRSITELAELVGDETELRPLLDELVNSRLLVVQNQSDGMTTVEIVHESLIITWPTLRRWLDASQEDSLFLDQLLAAAHQWDANRRGSGLLWSGEMVAELRRFQRRYQGRLPEIAEAFVKAIHRQAVRRKRIRRVLAMAGILTTAGLLAAAAVALVVISTAKATAVANEKRAVAAQSAAQQRLQERILAEKVATEEKAKKEAAEDRVKESKEQLKAKNEALQRALLGAEQQKKLAEDAQREAEQNAREAEKAKKEAELARREEEKLRRAAEERAKQAEVHLGAISPKL